MTEPTQNNHVPLPTDLNKEAAPAAPVAPANANPLSQFFRHPKLTMELPSCGKFYADGNLAPNEDGSLNVFPMTARDEIMMKSPDGLLSGSSVTSIIRSCIPGITNPDNIPSLDLDAILIAIRLASYDQKLEISTTCSSCKHTNDHVVDLRILLDNIPRGEIDNVIRIGEMTLELQPYTFAFTNANNKKQFEQEQMARSIIDKDMNEFERKEYFESMFNTLAGHNAESIVTSIGKITLDSGAVVVDKQFINEFVSNADRATIQDIRDGISKMNQTTALKPIDVTCEECNESYTTSVEFNQTNFFA